MVTGPNFVDFIKPDILPIFCSLIRRFGKLRILVSFKKFFREKGGFRLCFRVLRSASGIYGEKAARVCVFGDGFVTYASAQQVILNTSTRNFSLDCVLLV
jgi:hypothetical protein